MPEHFTSSSAYIEHRERERREKERLNQKAEQKRLTEAARKRDLFSRVLSLISLGVSIAALVLSFLFGMGYIP